MKKILLIILSSLLVILFSSSTTSADVDNFVINHFHADYEINNDVKGGSLLTKEKIDLSFSSQNHGIFRAIPKKFNNYNIKLKILEVKRDGVEEKHTTYSQNGNLVLKIGDPNKTITGKHQYQIVYHQERIIDFSDGQEFYWDINGNEWEQPFEKISANVVTKDGSFNEASPICYTGYEGSKERFCKYSAPNESTVYFESTQTMVANQGMTIGLRLTGTFFVQPKPSDKIKDLLPSIGAFLAGLLPLIFVYRFWKKQGKDHAGKGTFVPEYKPPKNLTPAEVGMLVDYSVDGKDLSATLIDLAVRGYIKIIQETKKVLFIKTNKFTLELIKTDFSKLKKHESSLISAVFDEIKVGSSKEMSKINKTRMSTSLVTIRQTIKDSLVKTYGLIDEKSDKSQVWLIVIGFLGIVICVLPIFGFLPVGFRVGLAVTFGSTALFGFLMRRRTHAGVEVYEKIKGLQLYMNTAERDRLKMMQSVDRPYAEPSKTVELFEELLPFAVALGVEKSWARQFDGILTEQPKWLASNTNAFSAGYLASSIGSVSTNFSSSFQTSSGASSGSSGGGGGGGGGGGW